MKRNSESEKYDNRFMLYFLSGVQGLGSVSILKLYNQFKDLRKIMSLSPRELTDTSKLSDTQAMNLVNEYSKINSRYEEYEMLLKSNIKYICYEDDIYPSRLRNISDPPAVLFVLGELPPENIPAVSIVGARAATSYGLSVAEYFGEVLAEQGIGIISGLAHGIDEAAHRGALNCRTGKTYAVLGGGVNIVYPRENIYLYYKIIENECGGIISEMLPGTNALSRNFPMRNRIISGLSDLVIIVEAREKSGSLITADLALEQGKDIMAIPGRITDPMSKGCNMLINAGARMANSPDDVMEILNMTIHHKVSSPAKKYNSLAKNEKIVYSTLDSSPKHLEEIVYQTGLPLTEVISILVELEIKGFASQISSNYYGIAPDISGLPQF